MQRATKLTILKRRSEAQEYGTLVSSQNDGPFDVVKWNALLENDPEIAGIANRLQSLGRKWAGAFATLYLAENDKQRLPDILQAIFAAARREIESVNDVELEVSQDPVRDHTLPPFRGAEDKIRQPTPASETVDTRAQPPSLATIGHFEQSSSHTTLLKAAEALESVDSQLQNLMDALRYLVELNSSDRPRDFAHVKRNLSNAHALIKSSIPTLPRVRAAAIELRAMAAEETRTANIPKPDERPAISADRGSKERDEQRRADMVLSEVDVLLRMEDTDRQEPILPDIPAPHQRDQDEQKRVGVVLSEIKVLLRESTDTKTAVAP